MANICIFSRFEDISVLRLETPIVCLNVYRLFLSRGADIHIRNKDGNTPAMVVKVFPVSQLCSSVARCTQF